jgi:hypothetical protein
MDALDRPLKTSSNRSSWLSRKGFRTTCSLPPGVLADYGPRLGRPYVDTLKGSKHSNMKELRFDAAGGVWRMAFAFDPRRQAVLLAAGDKSGVSQGRFYKQLIVKADKRFARHLERLKNGFSEAR